MNLQDWANSVVTIETEKRRLSILQYLLKSSGYEAVAGLLRLHCIATGVPSTFDQILAAIQWLEEQELITVRNHVNEPISRLTIDGREVAEGQRSVPGVLRPDP